MTRRPKSEALLRDIARLFVTYGAADWEPILKELHEGSALQRRIAASAQKIVAEQATTKTRKPKRPVARPAARKRAHPERASLLESLEAGLRSRVLLRDTKALRELLSRTGAKGVPPSARARAITALVEHLDQMPEERFTQLVEAIEQSRAMADPDVDDDYARWFALILDRPAEPAPSSSTHDKILSLMDRAMIRGAAKFSLEDEAKLILERDAWLADAGSPTGRQVVDRFLAIVRMARHAKPKDAERLDNEIYDLKQQWRSFSQKLHS